MTEEKKKTALTNGEKSFLSDEEKRDLREDILKDYRKIDQTRFLHQVERTKLDPFTNQIWARPERKEMERDGKYSNMVIHAGIWGFLTVADRSGVYDGSDPILWCGQNGEWVDVWLSQEQNPFAAKAVVWRKDHSRPEVAIVRWKAVVPLYYNPKDPKSFWVRMPDYMIGKCALAAALRKAFPNLLSGIYETDEVRDVDAEIAAENAKIGHAVIQAEIDAEAAEEAKAATVPAPAVPAPAVAPALDKDIEPPSPEPDDIPMAEEQPQRPENWWMELSCDPIGNTYYKGKTIAELDLQYLQAAVEKWVPSVRKKWDITTQAARDVAEALEIAYDAAQKSVAESEARAAARAAEGVQ